MPRPTDKWLIRHLIIIRFWHLIKRSLCWLDIRALNSDQRSYCFVSRSVILLCWLVEYTLVGLIFVVHTEGLNAGTLADQCRVQVEDTQDYEDSTAGRALCDERWLRWETEEQQAADHFKPASPATVVEQQSQTAERKEEICTASVEHKRIQFLKKRKRWNSHLLESNCGTHSNWIVT